MVLGAGSRPQEAFQTASESVYNSAKEHIRDMNVAAANAPRVYRAVGHRNELIW